MLIVIRVSGPLMTNVTSILRDVLITFFGFLMFPEVKLTWDLCLGMSVGFVGVGYHIYHKFLAEQQPIKEKQN